MTLDSNVVLQGYFYSSKVFFFHFWLIQSAFNFRSIRIGKHWTLQVRNGMNFVKMRRKNGILSQWILQHFHTLYLAHRMLPTSLLLRLLFMSQSPSSSLMSRRNHLIALDNRDQKGTTVKPWQIVEDGLAILFPLSRFRSKWQNRTNNVYGNEFQGFIYDNGFKFSHKKRQIKLELR